MFFFNHWFEFLFQATSQVKVSHQPRSSPSCSQSSITSGSLCVSGGQRGWVEGLQSSRRGQRHSLIWVFLLRFLRSCSYLKFTVSGEQKYILSARALACSCKSPSKTQPWSTHMHLCYPPQTPLPKVKKPGVCSKSHWKGSATSTGCRPISKKQDAFIQPEKHIDVFLHFFFKPH